MINRNCGIRGPTRSDQEREPKNEIITSRAYNESIVDNNSTSDTLDCTSIRNDPVDEQDDKDDYLAEEKVSFTKANGCKIKLAN